MANPASSKEHWVEISTWLCKKHFWLQDLPCWLMLLMWLWVTTRPGGHPEEMFWTIGIASSLIIICPLIWISCHVKVVAISETQIRLTSPYAGRELTVPHSSLIRLGNIRPWYLLLWIRDKDSNRTSLFLTQPRREIEEFRGRIHPEVVLNNIIAADNKKRDEAEETITT